MEASPTKVIQYFNGEKQNLIPLFQRPYTWRQANWLTLWNDVMIQYDQEEETTHFLGAIVSAPARSVPVGVSKYLIIDGQQRLTTISIMLCALRDCLDANSAARIQEVYLTNRFRAPEDTLKFVPTQADRDTYRSIVLDRRIPEDESFMVGAYNFFKKQIMTGNDVNGDKVIASRVLTTLEHCLQVVMINLGEGDDPYLIFESLNFKGEPLTQADLVRNYLLMRFQHSVTPGGEQERIYTAYWRPLENQLGDNLTEFLRHYAMKDGDNIKQGGIYAAIKTRLKDKDKDKETQGEVEAEITRMGSFGQIYASLLQPPLEKERTLQVRLEYIRELEVTTSYPLLLRLFEARRSELLATGDLERCLALVEAFVVRRAVCGVPTNALNKLFLQWCKNFPNSDHYSWLLTSMSAGSAGSSRRFPSEAEFSEAFKNQPQYGRGATRFVLCRLERALGHKETVDLATATIEHILPQTLTPEWIGMLGDDAEKTHARLVDTFGNLTLTGYNSELGNSSFDNKKETLRATHIELNRHILAQSTWREIEIQDRAEILLKKANELWPALALL